MADVTQATVTPRDTSPTRRLTSGRPGMPVTMTLTGAMRFVVQNLVRKAVGYRGVTSKAREQFGVEQS